MKFRILILLLCIPGALCAQPDFVLEQMSRKHASAGNEGVRAMGRVLGILLREEQGQVLVPVIVDKSVTRGNSFEARLKQGGGRVDRASRSWTRILVPAHKLNKLFNAFPDDSLRAPIPVFPATTGMGSVLSESVLLTGADGYQVGNLTGAGIKVAVIDLGFSKLNDAISAGELPADALDYAMDFTNTSLQSSTKHGTGVAEHVADMAPGAEIHYLKIGDEVDLQDAADYLLANNIDIANHSVVWVLASYYDDSGPINSIVNDSVNDDGVFWVVASGNSARKHWRGTWLDADSDDELDFVVGDDLLKLTSGASAISLYLNWDEYSSGSITNLDLELVDNNGVVRASSANVHTGKNAEGPYEALGYSYVSAEAPYHVRIKKISGNATGLDITMFSFHNDFEHRVTASSVLDPGSASGAFTVGAINQGSWNNANPGIRSYSSQGPTTDGRLKPELAGPDGTQSQTYGASSGTSFASPTVAGAAALLLDEDPTRTPAQLANLLQSYAVDVGIAGPDNVYGYGLLQLPLINSDSDALTNVDEIAYGTDPLDDDTDDDGLNDSDEITLHGTDPLLADTDGDGINDYSEVVVSGSDPTVSNRGDLAPRGALDGVVDVADYLILTRLVTGAITATGSEIVFGDLNYNDGLDAGDLVLMMRVVNGEIALP